MRIAYSIIIGVLALAWLCGCPNSQSRGKSLAPRSNSGAQGADKLKLLPANLFAGTALETDPPDSLSLNHAGDMFAVKVRLKGTEQYSVFKYGLGSGGFFEPATVLSPGSYGRNYLAIHPTEARCLLITNYQQGGPVIDRVIQAQGGVFTIIPYENTPGLVQDDRHDALYGLEPFYSWDGAQVIIPLRYTGICIYDRESKESRFVEYPAFIDQITGRIIKALPDQNGKRRIFASLWASGAYINTDVNRLYILDLDDLDADEPWRLVAETNWLIYSVGSADFDKQPWLVAGSRGRQTNVEVTRLPLIGRLDPASGQTTLLEFYGEPVWQVEVDPHGEYAAYMDRQRQGLVRLKPSTGEMEIDRSYFNEEAQLFIGEGADPVLAWHKGELVRANWTETEEFPGYDD